jgi:hypothetical protein
MASVKKRHCIKNTKHVFFISFLFFFINVLFKFYTYNLCVALAKSGQYSNKKNTRKCQKTRYRFFKYSLAKLYLIFPIVRIFQICNKK